MFEVELATEERALGYFNIDTVCDPGTGAAGGVAFYCENAPGSGYELEVELFDGTVYDVTDDGAQLGAVTTSEVDGAVTTVRFPLAWVGGDVALAPYMIIGDSDPSDCVPCVGGALGDSQGEPL